jgi:hypothetical protein
MSHLTQTRIAADPHLILRISACAAGEGVPEPQFWAQERMFLFASRDGWDTAFLGAADDSPGQDENAITDAMILAAVQALYAAEQTPEA